MDHVGTFQSPIVKESLDRKAANQLRDAVLAGLLRPGARLTEQATASQLGLSRSTVRAAFHRLASEGLVVQNMYSSWEVMSLTAEDAGELYTLRARLEGLAGRLAASRMTAVNKKRLSAAYQALVETADSDSKLALADADLSLHRTVVEIAGNKRLIHHYRQVEMQLRMYIASVNALLPSPQLVAAAHEPFVNALLASDEHRAEALMTEHSVVYGQKLVDLFTKAEATEAALAETDETQTDIQS